MGHVVSCCWLAIHGTRHANSHDCAEQSIIDGACCFQMTPQTSKPTLCWVLCALMLNIPPYPGYGDFDPRLYPNYNVVGIHPSNELAQVRGQRENELIDSAVCPCSGMTSDANVLKTSKILHKQLSSLQPPIFSCLLFVKRCHCSYHSMQPAMIILAEHVLLPCCSLAGPAPNWVRLVFGNPVHLWP